MLIDVVCDRAEVCVLNESRGFTLAERARVAGNPWSRLRGLLGRPALGQGEGLIILPCLGVHSMGMTYPIDVIHLDSAGVVRAVLHDLKPWRFGPPGSPVVRGIDILTVRDGSVSVVRTLIGFRRDA